jgi:hypothetical protein
MPDLPEPRDLIGRTTPHRELVIDQRQVRDFLDAIGEASPPFAPGSSSRRFGSPILPPTIWSVVRPGGDPEVAVPRYGTGLNAGNAYRCAQPAQAGEALKRQTRIADAYQREGRTGKLTFFVFETTITRPGGEVVATTRSSSVQRGG